MLDESTDLNTGQQVEHRTFRVGVINTGGQTVEKVSVKIATLQPRGLPFANISLTRMHSVPDNQGNYIDEFEVNPGQAPRRFVDVVNKQTGVKPWIELGATKRHLVISVPPGRYRLGLIVEGNVPSSETFFYIIDVDKNSGQLLFQSEGMTE